MLITMRAWLLDDFTGLSALRIGDAPKPAPGPGEVLIRLSFAALNPADRFLAERLYPAKPPLPHILGRDGSGIIEAIGEGVSEFKVGDEVCALRSEAGVDKPGTFAEYVCLHEDYVAPVPTGWTMEQAAAAPLVYLTAYQALTQWPPIPDPVHPESRTMTDAPAAETVLITGISGGVGIAALHLAKALGHRVIGITRGTSKHATLTRHGADLLLDPNDPQLAAKIKEFTDRRGVDIVVENVGGELFNTLLNVMAYHGCISVVGALAGDVPSFNPAKLLFRRTRVGGVLVFDYTRDQARPVWNQVLALLRGAKHGHASVDHATRHAGEDLATRHADLDHATRCGGVDDATRGARPVVDSVFPFDQLPDAFARLAQGPLGKVVMQIATS